MKLKLSKKRIMENYYSDEELKESMRMSAKSALNWLEEANRFYKITVPRSTKRLQEKLIEEGW